MKADIAAFAAANKPVYAECGGLMYLARGIRTLDGLLHPMVGLIPGEVKMHDRLQALGYAEVDTVRNTILGLSRAALSRPSIPAYSVARSRLRRQSGTAQLTPACKAAELQPRSTRAIRQATVLASYVHAHWASNPAVAEGFAASCARAKIL